MKSRPVENGLDELMRLSRQTAATARNLEDAEKQRRERREVSQSIRHGLRQISISVALEQLKTVAPAETIEKVKSLADKPDVKDLRRMVSDSVHGLERQTGRITAVTDVEKIQNSVKTLAILVELYFALSD
jgi:hypothetical protein